MAVASAPPTTSENGIDISTLKRWSLEDYHRLIELGILQPSDHSELIDGYICTNMPQNPPHADAIDNALDYLIRHLPRSAKVRSQSPITLPPNSEPEPDIAIVARIDGGYRDRHPGPNDIWFIIEIADSTLQSDLTAKANLYARNGIQDYWVVDVGDRHVWIHRQPSETGYQEIIELEQPEIVKAIVPGLEGVEIDLRSLFPDSAP